MAGTAGGMPLGGPNKNSPNMSLHRRIGRTADAEDFKIQEDKARKSQPDNPIHNPRDSLFSWSSGFGNFTGFVTWAFLLVTMGGFRLFLENMLNYGIRVDPLEWFLFLTGAGYGSSERPSLILVSSLFVPAVICLYIEKGLAAGIVGRKLGMISHVVNILIIILLPITAIYFKGPDVSLFGATVVCLTHSILFLKLWSYVHVNLWCRNDLLSSPRKRKRRSSLNDSSSNLGLDGDDVNHDMPVRKRRKRDKEHAGIELVQYPDNLNLKDLCYYIFAPTLCYELNFPRTSRIRIRFLLKRFIEVVVGCQVVMSMFQQWIIPSVKNTLLPFTRMFHANEFPPAIERLLKLAIPNHLVWLIFFYLGFHSFLNLLGELLHFADRHFYNDWWNANNIDLFWRNWNLPVHNWALRHLYFPLVNSGYSKLVAKGAVFCMSAFFHEYLIGVPLGTLKYWAFSGMLAQIPLSSVSKFFEVRCGPRWGNVIVWASLILGQPFCIMMYYWDYIKDHFGSDHLEKM